MTPGARRTPFVYVGPSAEAVGRRATGRDMARLTAEDRADLRADHEAGGHADLDLFIFGCPLCDASAAST